MKYIIIGKRIIAYGIDYLIFITLIYLLSSLGALGYGYSILIFFLYRYIMTSLTGTTLGMMFLKIKISKYDFKICFKREIYRLSSHFFYIGYLYALIDTYGRTFHDVAAGVCVGKYEEHKKKSDRYVIYIAFILLILSGAKEISNFFINDVGLIGLKKVYQSDEYYQSFDGDNLSSISQDELYMKTLGRKYTTIVDFDSKPYIYRISNKLKYTEVYKLDIENKSLNGTYMYKVDMPIQYICSGVFINKRDFCGLSPTGNIIITKSTGEIYAKSSTNIKDVLIMRCGDVDRDGKDEIVILGINGDVDIFKYTNNALKRIYYGKIGEDIIPQSFYIDNNLYVMSKSDKGNILYVYNYENNKFKLISKKYTNIKGTAILEKVNNGFVVSYINRGLMMFKMGKIQRLEQYDITNGVRIVYNFGERTGRRYSYYVRSLECIEDIDGDGEKEVILKAVGKEDIMGQGYVVEVYKFDKKLLIINKILTQIEKISVN